jgi:hypothetical protein
MIGSKLLCSIEIAWTPYKGLRGASRAKFAVIIGRDH